jgi:urease beta subunit
MTMKPGEYFIADGEIELNHGREPVRLRVDNVGDRPIQVGSHTHFFEVNRFLHFDRATAYGRRLDIPAGTALRFEPGEGREVHLILFGGRRHAYGMSALTDGALDERRDEALREAHRRGFMKEHR